MCASVGVDALTNSRQRNESLGALELQQRVSPYLQVCLKSWATPGLSPAQLCRPKPSANQNFLGPKIPAKRGDGHHVTISSHLTFRSCRTYPCILSLNEQWCSRCRTKAREQERQKIWKNSMHNPCVSWPDSRQKRSSRWIFQSAQCSCCSNSIEHRACKIP